jgi:hypothetical protein
MKNLFFKIVCTAATFSVMCCSDNGKILERPRETVNTGARTEIFQKIMAQFPEHQNISTSQQALFEASAGKHVILSSESEVYVTFISEGASYPNTIGWYSYTEGSKPTQPSDVDLHVLFPHITDRVLKQGDRLQVGDKKFPAGTVIGFFLIISGWDHGEINYGRQTFYTDQELNPDDQQQHVLFKQKELGDIVLTFEDELTSQQSDRDFNDIIFTVTDNKDNQVVSKFNLTNVVVLE